MIDPAVIKLRYIQYVIDLVAARADDAVRPDFLFDTGDKLLVPVSGTMLSAPLQQPENRHFSGCSTASFAFPQATKIALIGLDFSEHGGVGFSRQMGNNHLVQLVIEQDCRTPSTQLLNAEAPS